MNVRRFEIQRVAKLQKSTSNARNYLIMGCENEAINSMTEPEGNLSRITLNSSFSYIVAEGISPAMILQKIQSLMGIFLSFVNRLATVIYAVILTKRTGKRKMISKSILHTDSSGRRCGSVYR